MSKIEFLPLSLVTGGCKTHKSVSAFAKLLAKDSYFSENLYLPYVYWNLAVDHFHYHTIENYKLGNISTDEFRKKIQDQLGSNFEQVEFDHAWNEMCEVSLQDAIRIRKIFWLAKMVNLKIYLVSFSNPLQFDYIKEQLQSIDHFDFLDSHKNINFVNSFEFHESNFNALINATITRDSLDIAENEITLYNINSAGGYYQPKLAKLSSIDHSRHSDIADLLLGVCEYYQEHAN